MCASWSRSCTPLPDRARRQFDLVYTGVGALNWLPDIAGWARVVAALLRPGGRSMSATAHPMLITLRRDSTTTCCGSRLPYFEGQPERGSTSVTYTDGDPIASPEQYEWNHGSARSCRP
jgi:hypothetical protein